MSQRKAGYRRPPGKPITEDGLMARELGTDIRFVQRLGGAAKLRSLDPGARAVLMRNRDVPGGRPKRKGGIRALGMLPQMPAMLTQSRDRFLIEPHAAGEALDMVLSDEDLDCAG